MEGSFMKKNLIMMAAAIGLMASSSLIHADLWQDLKDAYYKYEQQYGTQKPRTETGRDVTRTPQTPEVYYPRTAQGYKGGNISWAEFQRVKDAPAVVEAIRREQAKEALTRAKDTVQKKGSTWLERAQEALGLQTPERAETPRRESTWLDRTFGTQTPERAETPRRESTWLERTFGTQTPEKVETPRRESTWLERTFGTQRPTNAQR